MGSIEVAENELPRSKLRGITILFTQNNLRYFSQQAAGN